MTIISYFLMVYPPTSGEGRPDKGYTSAEMICFIVIFPFASFISPALNIIWVEIIIMFLYFDHYN